MSLKTDVLQILDDNTDTYLSGQELASTFGVSRNAVWKAINQLKDDGYIIHSVTNKGYCLSGRSDVLSKEKIFSYMSPKTADNMELYLLDTVDSTNNEAKRMIANGLADNALIVANEQTGGRGRLGRSFFSPKNTGAYMTFVFHPDVPIADAVAVTTAASVAVVRAISRLTTLKPQIKWVNDVYLNNKKICGILTEAITDFETGFTHSVIIGIGVNTTTDNFPKEISNTATALNFCGLSRNMLIAAISDEMFAICSDVTRSSTYIEDYRSHSLVIGKKITYYKNNEKYSATAIDIDNDGSLVVKNELGQTEILHSGEITVRLSEQQ